jgi:hypothetical protein
LETASQGLQGVESIVQSDLLFDMVALLIEELTSACNNCRFRASDVLGQSSRVGLEQRYFVKVAPPDMVVGRSRRHHGGTSFQRTI